MQRNQWNAASAQLLKHWIRSGISQIPTTTAQSVSTANSWLKTYYSNVFEPTDSLVIPRTTLELLPPPPPPPPAETPANSAHDYEVPSLDVPVLPVLSSSQIAPAPLATNHVAQVELFPSKTPPNNGGAWISKPLTILDRLAAFDFLNSQVVDCRKCEEIVCRRQRTVFGVGSVQARVVMFGEAPGADEDRVGEPFVGAAGQLLDKILVASGLKRSEVYIVNALKCMPPNNRTPTDGEIENCRPFFESQLETIQPEYIVCWGSVAVRAVLGSTDSVGRLRGKFHSFRGAKVLVTYHPAYLLRTPDAKKLTWEDMKMLMKDMGIPIPAKN